MAPFFFNYPYMKKAVLFTAVIFFMFGTVITGKSQNMASQFTYNQFTGMTIMPVSAMFNTYNNQIRNSINKTMGTIAGTPYVYEDFKAGEVYPKDKNEVYKLDLNINAYSDMCEFEFDGDIYEMPNSAFDSIKVGKITYIPVSVFHDDVIKFYAMEVLDQDGKGNYLVKKYVVEFLEATIARAYHQATPATYQAYPAKYYFYNSKTFKLVALNRPKALLKDPEFPDGLAGYLDENRVKPRNVADLQGLFDYIYGSN